MKYEIKDLEKGKTIKSVQVVDTNKPVLYLGSNTNNKVKVIMVNYLDGTQDVFEFNEETLKRIQIKADAQAQMFVNKNKDSVALYINALIGILGLIVFIVCITSTQNIIFSISVLSAIFTGLVTTNFIRLSTKKQSIKKHKIYVEKIMGKLEEYNEILKKENGLSKEANKELVDIINIDKTSVKELEYIGNKIERYNEIEGKKPKIKSL